MKIKTKLFLNVLVSLALLLTVGITLYWSKQEISRSLEMSRGADEITRYTFELNLAIDQYLLYPEERPKIQFRSAYESVQKSLAMIKFESPEEQDIFRRIRQVQEEMGSLFNLLVSTFETKNIAREEPLFAELRERVIGQLLTRSREIMSDAFQLSNMSYRRIVTSQQKTIFSVIVAILISGMLMAIVSYLIGRSILNPVRKLEEGAKSISSGNLDYKIDIDRGDEIGQLSKAFNEMTNQLKTSYASIEDLKRAEEALRESQKDLNRAQAVARTGSWRLDVRRNELLWSDETHRMFGIPKGTPLTYDAFLATVHPEDWQIVNQSWQASLRGEPYDIEHRIVVGDTVRWVRERAELEFDRQGILLGGFGTVQDITDRKRMEETIVHLASFPELNPSPVVEIDLTGHVHYTNPAAKQLFHDLPFAGLAHPWFADFESMAMMLQKDPQTFHTREIRIRNAWYEQSIFYTPEWNRIRIYGRDITERKRAEEELRRSQALLIEAERLSHTGAWEWDLTSNQWTFSDEWLAIHGCQKHTLSSEELLPIAHADDRADIERAFEDVCNGTRPYDIEHRAIRQDTGEVRIVKAYGQLFRDAHGAPMKVLGVAQDITERKQAEEALKKSMERFELLSETANRLLATDKPQEIVNDLCQNVMAHLDCHAFFNYLVDEEKGRLHLNAYAGIPEEVGKQIEWLDYGVAVCGCAARDACRIVCENIPETPDPRTELVKSFGIKAYACHPLFSAGRVIGTLSFGTRSTLTFNEDELSSMKTVADQVAIAMERMQLIETIRRSRDELEIRVQERTAELAKTYKKLEGQSKILEGFFTSTITPLVFLDRDFNFIRVNEAYAKACQRKVSEFPGHNHFEFYPSDAKEKFEQVVETREPYQAIARPFTFPDHPEWGKTYWDWTLTPILDDTGEVEFLVFSLEDVTKRQQAEEAIKAERQRFNDVLEMLPAYLVLLTPDHHMPFANRFFRERFGESHGRRCFDYLFGRSEPCEICETYTVLKTNAPHHWEWTGPDGRIYDIYDFPFTDTDGSPLIMEMGIDITERKHAEEKVKAASLYTRSLIEASLDPLVTISTEGKVADVNKATELVTGVSREQLIGSDFSDYFTEPEKARVGYQQVLAEGVVRDYPLAIRHRSGMITDVLYHATIYRNEAGEIQGVFAAARDITERKEIQRRIEATNAILDLFVKKSKRKEYLDSIIELIQRWSGCRCVGIRVLDEKDYIPYESYLGFSQDFWESENCLSIKYDQCACIRVVRGNPDPQDLPVMTPAGSFRCENTFEFVGNLSEEEKARFRGVCIQNGFKSVSIIPIRYHDKVLGAIHLADEREGNVPLNRIEFIESMAPLIGEAVNRFNLEEEIRESENRLRSLSLKLLSVQETERKRVAHELHDGIGQMLTAVKFKVENTLQKKGKAKRESLEDIIPMIRESVEEVRRIQMDLRPSILDDLGILATLSWFCRNFETTYSHIHIEKQIDIQEEEVSVPLKTVIYRISQEGLNNIAKHSRADLVHLSLGKADDRIELTIQDNGLGFDLEKAASVESPRQGLGLTSMRERAELSGGSFAIESVRGKGTTIRAMWTI